MFADNEQVLGPSENGLYSTLQRYNSSDDCAYLTNQAAVDAIKLVVKQNAIRYYAELGFDVARLDFEVVNLWLNEMRGGSAHVAHAHYGFQVSGCFYVDVPAGSGVIKFHTQERRVERGGNPLKEFTQYTSSVLNVMPKAGDMWFWESLLIHEVPALQFDGVRRSIAYDIAISKKLDQQQTLPEPSMETRSASMSMNLKDYIAIFNINDSGLCSKIVQMQENEDWTKHTYYEPITKTSTSYADDLEVLYRTDETTAKLQEFFEECVREYVRTVSPGQFACQGLTDIRFNRYKVGTNMKIHADHIHSIFDGERKGVPILTLLALLNEDFEGGDFIMFGGEKVKLSLGDVIVFPSNFLYPHGVTTVTRGVRHSCVAWGY